MLPMRLFVFSFIVATIYSLADIFMRNADVRTRFHDCLHLYYVESYKIESYYSNRRFIKYSLYYLNINIYSLEDACKIQH